MKTVFRNISKFQFITIAENYILIKNVYLYIISKRT